MPVTPPLFTILDSVGSTNNYAMAKVHAGLAKHGNAYYCAIQTEGKGQRGKNWHTGNGQNIALSIIIQPAQLLVRQQFILSALVALACYEFFEAYAGDETKIKWPNDIYWNDRKAGGILIENVIGSVKQENTDIYQNVNTIWKYAIVGIGININQILFDKELSNVVSLKQITGKNYDVIDLAKALHFKVLNMLDKLSANSFEEILFLYNQHLYKKDCLVKLKKGNIVFETRIKSVSEKGELCTIDAVERFFNFGEVQWVL